jgi:tRNA(fMet)-specific endonuclease VapC
VSWLLDTNICIAFLNGKERAVRDRLIALPVSEVHLCSVVKAELLYGARNGSRADENLSTLDRFFTPFLSLAFDDDAAAHYGIVRSQLKREGRPIGGNDLLIASIALAHDATLVTRDAGEFRRVSGLRVETW